MIDHSRPDDSPKRSPHRLRIGFLVVCLICTHARAELNCQAVVLKNTISGRVKCQVCRIRVNEIARIGDKGGTIVEWPQSIWQDSKGRFFVMQPNQGEPPQVYSSTGRFLRTLGREGSGPGEYRNAAIVFGDARDTVFVVDWGTSRLTVLGPSLQLVRSFPIPASTLSGSILSDGSLVVNATVEDRATVGLPFHLFDRGGKRFTAKGDKTRPYVPSTQHLFAYRLSPSLAGGFWAFPFLGRYELELWRGDSLAVYTRESVAWFVTAPARLTRADGPAGPPISWINGGWEDSSGLLWVVARVADSRGPGSQELIRGPEGNYSVPKDADRDYDTMIEVIDPKSKVVLVSQRFDNLFALVVGKGKVAQVEEMKDGRLEVRVFEVSLERRP